MTIPRFIPGASLLLVISLTNVFNRLNVATRQVAGPGW